MIVFALAALLMIAAVLALLLAPLWRREAPPAAERRDYDLAVHRDQLREIDRDLEQELFTVEEAAAARLEIERRMLAAADGAEPAARAAAGRSRMTAVAVGLFLPLTAVLLYLVLGSPGRPDLPLAARQSDLAQQNDMQRLVQQLRQRLQQQPGNPEGWLLLARSYATLGQLEASADAYRRAADLTNRRADILSAWGEVLTEIDGKEIGDDARRLFEEALAQDPGEPRARFYVGAAKAQGGDLKGALDDWLALAAQSPPEAPWMPALTEQIRAAAAKLGGGAGGPSAADVDAASKMAPADRDAMIRTMVEGLAEKLRENPNDREGWLRLGRSYQVLGETEKAEDAFARARALGETGR
jgi:cytochrome c-type biogenesis protein CcmH